MKQIIPVVSGKGGVGKSTVAVNLAVALAAQKKRVALIDADFYGPSVPILLGGGEIRSVEENKLIPPERFGVRFVSISFFLEDPDTPVIWRGPMLHKAMQQLFADVAWGEIDYCIVDMPPGTGDAQISLSQLASLTGAVVVTTPQEVAAADVRKAINKLRTIKVEVLGIVENMAGFVAPDGTRHDIFGAGGGEKMAEQFGVPLLASIPLDARIRESGDRGLPAAAEPDKALGPLFSALALKLIGILDKKPRNKPSLRVVE